MNHDVLPYVPFNCQSLLFDYKAQDQGVAQPGSASGFGTRGSQVQIPAPTILAKKQKFIPSKTAMQSGYGKTKNWVLEFEKLLILQPTL